MDEFYSGLVVESESTAEGAARGEGPGGGVMGTRQMARVK